MNQYHKEAATENYAKYTAILQSSGMGKSRLIDEMSKNTFLIPLCLRKETSGFPPPDKRVADHLTSKCDETECVRRSFAFLAALFDHTANWVKDHRDNGDDYSSLSSRFRSYLVKDQQATMHGKGRIAFYAEVLRLASQYEREIHEDRPRSKTEDINRSTHEPATQDIKTPPRPKGGIATPDKSPKFFFPASTSRSTQASQYATLAQKAQALTDLLSDLPMSSEDGPLMVLAFDESHVLTEVSDEKQGWSFFSCMRRALRSIRNQRCFAFFLSTTGQVFQFTPSKENDRSARVQDSLLLLIPPFTDIGLDQLARKIRENELSIGDVAKIAYMVTLGRPMISSRYKHGDQDIKLAIVDFAAQRLVGSNWRKGELSDSQKLACLAVRLALDFNPDTAEARKKELKQIEHHLRVCMTVSETLDRVKSLPPSEPIIAEAARKVMKDVDTFKPVSALLTEFRRPDVKRGPRGETVVMLMATLASDAAAKKDEAIPLVDFLEQLFALPVGQSTHIDNFKEALPSVIHPNSQEKYHNIPLHSAFKDARLNFNHFVKVNDFKTINQKFLWRLIARGAAVLCANCQAGIDFLIPYSYWDQQLGRYNVGVILVQVKNDMKFGGLPREYLFDAMDPIKLGIFDDNGKEPMPVIRIVAALASKDILLRNFKYGDPQNSTAKKPGSSKAKASPTKKTTKATVPEAGSSRARASPRKSAVNASNSRNLRSGSRGNKSKHEHEPLNKNAEETTVPIRRYTAYDFYCGGLHPDVWKPMSKEREDWQSLLDVSGSWATIYKGIDRTTESIRRSQAPGSATNRSHWSSWTYVDEDGMSDDGGCISAEEDV
ncbi:hypothetical protein BD410DRAFT_65329 [Rickenella mellea]|uniref:Uncharacterized protein n=1 Tax=Rickenella mellea TaxID=50990 RepID=A0A4Y7QDD6_9AGAM|nr:hypothetical protein BD410DRAFT_65329 [Rickenella mellea]